MTIHYAEESPEVLYSTDPVLSVNHEDIALLIAMADRTKRRRIRLCAHPNPQDNLHEMLIVHARGTYVPPHAHPGKSEAFHVISGDMTVFVFDENGTITHRIPMSAMDSTRSFYYRLSTALYHTVVPETEWVVFHEITNGPFLPSGQKRAPWAPGMDGALNEQTDFINNLMAHV